MMDLKRVRDGANWSDHPHGIFKAGTQGWQMERTAFGWELPLHRFGAFDAEQGE